MAKPIVITGYPYAYPYYFKVFEYVENKGALVFILPKHWEAKNGKVKINLEERSDFKIFSLSVCSYGGKSLFAGLFKGWMPATCLILLYLRLKHGSGVLYSCLEPNLLTTLYNGFFAKLFGYKHILFTWQNVAPEKRMSGLKLKLSNTLVKLNLALSDGIICGNTKAAEIIKHFEISKYRNIEIIVCPLSGVDMEKFKPGITSSWREKLNIKDDEKIILFYGALEKRKGLNILVDAFQLLTTHYSLLTKLIIVGTGPEKKDLELRIRNYELGDRTVFLDWLPNEELPSLLNTSDIFIYPSVTLDGWEEQFGYAMAEASACEVPVVATRGGSMDEVVIDGKSGILVEPNRPEQLAEVISKILSDSELAQQMGRFGREHIVKNFSHEVVAKKIGSFLSWPK